MSLLSSAGKIAGTAINVSNPILLASGLVGAATGGKYGTDLTPGYSAKNVYTTQNNKGNQGVVSNPQVAGATNDTLDLTIKPGGQYTSGGSTGGSGGTSAYDAAYYNNLTNQANSQLGQLDDQQNIGLGNIGNAYNSSLNALLGDQALAQRNYQTSKDQTLQDYTGARGNSQAQVGQQANSLQRLLGAHGYQGSANQAAGYAAALQGSQQNQALEQGFGRNQQALDTNIGDYNNRIGGEKEKLNQQKYQQENSLKQQVQTNKQSLLQQLSQIAQARSGNVSAGAGYDAQANALGNSITQLGNQYANPVLQATSPVYQAPSLESYTVNPAAAAQVQQGGAAGNVSPYLSVLLGGQDKKKTLV